MSRGRSAVDALLRAVAFGVLASTAWGAVHDVSQAYDSGYYHLPFAARLVGILPEDVFVFHAANRARFSGFPLLGELLQGMLWKVTGHAPATNLVAFSTIPLFAWFLRTRFAVPFHVGVVALFSIPLVMTHAASTYVDLPANAALAGLFLLGLQAWTSDERVGLRTVGLGLALAAIAVNMKALAGPLAVAGIVALAFRAWKKGDPRSRKQLLILAVALPLVFFTPLKNAAMHRNPFFPIRTSVLGVQLPGVEEPYSSSPKWLASSPQPVRFAASVLEMGVRPYSDPRRWTVDQWMPSDADGYRMGGFFGAWVIVNLLLLIGRAVREGGAARKAAVGFGVLTAIVSVMPQSHELRYYMVWMIALVATNAWLARKPDQGRVFGLLALAAMLVVFKVTELDYVRASGSTFEQVLAKKVDAAALARVPDGGRVCVDRAPWSLLYAAPFHAPRRYVVIEAEAPEDCGGAPPL